MRLFSPERIPFLLNPTELKAITVHLEQRRSPNNRRKWWENSLEICISPRSKWSLDVFFVLCPGAKSCPVYTVRQSSSISSSHDVSQPRGPVFPQRLAQCPPLSSICHGEAGLLRILAFYRSEFFSCQHWCPASTTLRDQSNAGDFCAGEVRETTRKPCILNLSNALVPTRGIIWDIKILESVSGFLWCWL